MDGYDLYKPAHVLYIRTTGTTLLRHHQEKYGFVINLTTKDMAFPTDWWEYVRDGIIVNSKR